jgi:hypothetical protein
LKQILFLKTLGTFIVYETPKMYVIVIIYL